MHKTTDRKLITDSNRFFYYCNYYAFFILGIYVLMIGTVLPYLLKETGMSLTTGGTFLATQAIGNVVGGLVFPVLSDHLGRKSMLASSPASIACGYTLVLCSNTNISLMYFGFLLSGIGWGGINNLVNLTVSETTNGNSALLSRTHMFFALGALTAPILTTLAVSLGFGWRVSASVLILMAIFSFLAYIFVKFPASTKHKSSFDSINSSEYKPYDDTRRKKLKSGSSVTYIIHYMASHSRFMLFMGVLFFYVGFENCINGWVVTYFINSGRLSNNAAQISLSLFWITCTAGRMLIPIIFKQKPQSFILLNCSIGALISFIVMLTIPYTAVIAASIGFLGFSLASVYPVTVSSASKFIGESGLLAALLMCCGALGASIIPWLVGLISDYMGITVGMVTAGLSCIMLLILSIYNHLYKQDNF